MVGVSDADRETIDFLAERRMMCVRLRDGGIVRPERAKFIKRIGSDPVLARCPDAAARTVAIGLLEDAALAVEATIHDHWKGHEPRKPRRPTQRDVDALPWVPQKSVIRERTKRREWLEAQYASELAEYRARRMLYSASRRSRRGQPYQIGTFAAAACLREGELGKTAPGRIEFAIELACSFFSISKRELAPMNTEGDRDLGLCWGTRRYLNLDVLHQQDREDQERAAS